MFTSAPVLVQPNSKKQLIVDVNTFDARVKAVLPITVSNYVLFSHVVYQLLKKITLWVT